MNIPSSTLTFLFTDIEGSTQLWEKYPAAMKLALARHDVILRQAIEAHTGQVFKTVGDAFCAVFFSAQDAVSATLEAQWAISAESWGETPIKVRMGLHSGAAEQRDNDYFGPTLNRVARLMSVGHGGQILLSAITRELVQANLPEDVELRDMGERRLKDLIRPEHIYQLTAIGLQTDFPPMKTLEAFRTNLPVQLTSFIGREKEITAVKGLMAENRLITLTGSGGTGKTRLSLQVAADSLDSFPDGVWFVELAPLSDPALVPQTVLTTLGLREESGRPVLETLIHYLHTKKVLLILDNCEHLVEAAAQFADALLHACTNLRLLVSSREALGIAGEKAFHVRSLSTPKMDALPSAEIATQYESINLFVDRAQTVSSSFAITPTNVSAVAQICARLDGIPLAIELAAARVKLLKPEQIAERLDDRFRLLTGGSRTALPRQQTLRAMIDWSYDLLPEAERVLLRRLSVFAGGWTLEAAETVCQGPGIDDYDVLTPLAQLVNKSLVVVDADDRVETRYRLLETVRQYAREKLSETGEGMAVRDSHLQYFLGLAERAEPELVGPNVVEWFQRLEKELDNIYGALEWSLKNHVSIGLQLINSLPDFFDEIGYKHIGYKWLTKLLNHPDVQVHSHTYAKGLTRQGFSFILEEFGQDAKPILEKSLAICQELGDQQGLAKNLLYLGLYAFHRGEALQGRRLVFESLSLYRAIGDKRGVASALNFLGGSIDTNDNQKTQAYLTESLSIHRDLNDSIGVGHCLADLGNMALQHGDFNSARIWLEESLTIQKKLSNRGTRIIYMLVHLGELAARTGDTQQARAYCEEGLSLIQQSGGNSVDTRWVTVKLGYIAIWQADIKTAKKLFEQSLQYFTEANEIIGVVYTLEGLMGMAVQKGKMKAAAQILSWVDFTRGVVDSIRPPVEQADVDRDLATIRAYLDDAAFVAAQEAGRAMSMDEAITLALESTHE